MSERIKPIDTVAEIPTNLSDEEMIDFLDERGVSEAFLENAPEAPEDERPIPRTKPINALLDDFTLTRLDELAARRNVGYQALLKQFVTERLYEEEKRESLLPVGSVASAVQEPPADAERRETPKPRDWQSWVYAFVEENEELLEDPDIDSITLSRLAKNASSPLLELSQEIRRASAKQDYPAARLRRMLKGYDRLKKFAESALALYEEKFGAPAEDTEGEPQADPDRPTPEVERVRNALEAADGVVIDARERFAM